MSSRGNTVFVDTVATASAPTSVLFIDEAKAIVSTTRINSLYNPTPIPCQPTSPPYFLGFGAACSQLSGSFSGGYVSLTNPAPLNPSQGTLIVGVNIGFFDKKPVVVWTPASFIAGGVNFFFKTYGSVTQVEDGSYFFGIYVGSTTWPPFFDGLVGPEHIIEFVFNIFG